MMSPTTFVGHRDNYPAAHSVEQSRPTLLRRTNPARPQEYIDGVHTPSPAAVTYGK